MSRVEFEIYETLPGGGRLWRDSAVTLEHAKNRLTHLNFRNPAAYVIYHASSGKPLDQSSSVPDRIIRYRRIVERTIGATQPGLFVNKFKKFVFSLRSGYFPSASQP
jgi:hypothetical protein